MPALSVIIPTYNRADLLCKAVESVLKQTFTDYEVIIVDDGSTDRTEDAIARLMSERQIPGERIRYFFQPNQGKSVALNYGLAQAKGEWIAFLDSDDLWLPNKIEEQFKVLHQYAPQSTACFTDARYINNPLLTMTALERSGKHYSQHIGIIADPVRHVVTPPHGIYMQTILVHARTMRQVGEFDPALRVSEDTDFVFRLAMTTQLCFINEPLVLIDRTPLRAEGLIEIIARGDRQFLDARKAMFEKWLRLSAECDADIRKAIWSLVGGAYNERGNWFLKEKRYREALSALSVAAKADLNPKIAAKCCLAALAPPLARRIVIGRERRSAARARPVA